MKLSKTIILLLLMLFYGTSYILSASKDSEDERIHLMEYLMDNNLGYSQEVRLRDIAQWENELVEVFRSRKDYKYMFLMQQMAVYALVSDGHINEALEKANVMLKQATQMKYDIGIAIAHYAIGDTYLNANMNNEAIEEYEIAMQKLHKVSDSEKLQEKVLIQLIPTLIRMGRMDKAKAYLDQMEQMNDYQHSRFIENIFQAYYYLHNNDMDKVRKYIQEAEEWYEYYPFYFHSSILKYIQAEYAKRIGDDELAIKLYNELTINTSSANVYNRYLKMKNSLAHLYTKQSRPREACAIFQDKNTSLTVTTYLVICKKWAEYDNHLLRIQTAEHQYYPSPIPVLQVTSQQQLDTCPKHTYYPEQYDVFLSRLYYQILQPLPEKKNQNQMSSPHSQEQP